MPESYFGRVVGAFVPIGFGTRALRWGLVIPKPVLFSVGENYKGGAQVFGVATRLLFGLIGVKVRLFASKTQRGPRSPERT